MYHSVTFGDKNTWDDWHLVPSSRPIFAPPTVKTKTIEIPGGNGVLDLSEALTGYPVYNNRTGSLKFIVVDDNFEPVSTHTEWYNAYSAIMDYLHGQKLKAILEDDKEYYYEGRFAANNWDFSKNYSTIEIEYDVSPYKLSVLSSTDDWLWNPFNFETGVIMTGTFKDIPITTTEKSVTFDADFIGRAPVCPTISVSTTSGKGAYVRCLNQELGIDDTEFIPDGTTQIPQFIFFGSSVTMYMKSVSGTGTVSIDFRKGRL
jgi:hypothetical protein